jgi:hypothetical protein
MKYGYARVSTDDQSTALQLAALKRAGCKTFFKDEGQVARPSKSTCAVKDVPRSSQSYRDEREGAGPRAIRISPTNAHPPLMRPQKFPAAVLQIISPSRRTLFP